MSRKPQLISLLCALLIPAAALAVKPGPGERPSGKACKPFRPNQPSVGTPVSHAMPRIHRPSAKVTTWGTQTTWQPIRQTSYQPTYNRDPYKLEMKGYNEGSKVTLKLQQKSATVQLPEACPGCASPAPAKLKNPAKWAKKQRSNAWRKAVAQALNFQQLEQFQVTVPSHAQTQIEQRANILPTHTPYKVEGRDAFNRKYATLQGHAEGLTTSAARQVNRQQRVGSSNYSQRGSQTDSGLHVPAYDVKTNTNTQNLYVTPAYKKGEAVQSKVLGLAAFPAGAKITVTNTRMEGAGEANHTVSFKASKSGSGGIVVPGLQRDKLRVTVSFDAVQNKAAASSYSFNTRIPTVAGRPAFQARGINYYGAALE